MKEKERESLRASPPTKVETPSAETQTQTNTFDEHSTSHDAAHSSRALLLFINYSLSLVSLCYFSLFVPFSFDVQHIKVEDYQSKRFQLEVLAC